MRQLQATTHAISDSGLFKVAPSIFADEPDFEVSDRYSFVPTIKIVDTLRDAGWFPSFVSSCNSRSDQGIAVAKHQIRFRQSGAGTIRNLNDSIMELVLTNSHDRSSGFLLDAGLFRKVCDNGLIVKDSDFGSFKIRHTGDANVLVAEAAETIVKDVPRIQEIISEWECIDLDEHTQLQLATRGSALRWGETGPVQAKTLLTPHRYADNKNDLWSTFNRIQENLMQGGSRGRARTGRRLTTRAVSSIDVGRKINQGLWEAAAEVAAERIAA